MPASTDKPTATFRFFKKLERIIFPPLRFFYYKWLKLFNIHIDRTARISILARLSNPGPGEIRVGKNTEVLEGARILTYGGTIIIGDNCSINPEVTIYGHGGVRIGANVQIATQSTIIPANHIFSDPSVPIANQGLTTIGIQIEDDVWIGTGCRILDGVTIGRRCVIGANSVVTRSTSGPGVYLGSPARKIREIDS